MNLTYLTIHGVIVCKYGMKLQEQQLEEIESEVEEIEDDSGMDLLVVLTKASSQLITANNPNIHYASAELIADSVAIQFGKDIKVHIFPNYYCIEFPNKTKAAKAVMEGLNVDLQANFPLMNMYHFFTKAK